MPKSRKMDIDDLVEAVEDDAWAKRFPNPHTRPDLKDPLTAKLCADSKRLFGHDVLEEAIDVPDYLEALQKKWATPEHQLHIAELEREEQAAQATQADLKYRRRVERLSPIHVKAVLAGCTGEQLDPITTTDLQRQTLAQWDGKESMFLLGATGIGKTYTATWCAMRAARRGTGIAFTTATKVCQVGFEGLLGLRRAGLLILDQLHTLRSPAGRDAPAWKVDPVVDLINHRYEQELTTIAAGTIAPEAMVDLLGADVRRRFPLRLASELTEIRRMA